MHVQASRLRPGMIIEFKGQPHTVMTIMHLTPGNKRALVQSTMRNIITGLQRDHRFSATEHLTRVHLEFKTMQYLYHEGEQYHFMNTETYDQVVIDKEAISAQVDYLKEQSVIKVGYYEGIPVTVELPKTVDLEVVETEPNIRSATASASMKKAKLETGLTVNVPQFIKEGDVVKIKTESGEYLERT
jgi:elongation factor P